MARRRKRKEDSLVDRAVLNMTILPVCIANVVILYFGLELIVIRHRIPIVRKMFNRLGFVLISIFFSDIHFCPAKNCHNKQGQRVGLGATRLCAKEG